MSDSEDSSASIPPDSKIEGTLRVIIAHLYKTDNLENLTVKRVRAATAKKLNLRNAEFLKSDIRWNKKSKEIITSEVDKQEDAKKAFASSPSSSSTSPVKLIESTVTIAKKRKQEAAKPPPGKRRKTTSPAEIQSDDDEAQETTKNAKSSVDDDSDMSSLIDEPAPRKGKKTDASVKVEKTGDTKAKSKSTNPALTPQQEEVKRLQGHLVKCGVRKLWHNELKHCESDSAKIKHLKCMLEDVGMTGRFSEDKARQIMEDREFKADLDDIKEGNKNWGNVSGDKEENEIRPKRKLAKGLHELLAFADEEESD